MIGDPRHAAAGGDARVHLPPEAAAREEGSTVLFDNK